MEPEDAVAGRAARCCPSRTFPGAILRRPGYTGEFPESLVRCEGELIRPGDKRLVLAVTFTPLRNEIGRLLNVIVNVHDITRFREEEEMKSTFTSIISTS